MTVTLPYPPSANRYWRQWQGRMLVSREARVYKQVAGAMAIAARMRPIVGDVHLTIDVYRPARRGDLDNTLKVCIDSLRGIAFNDDNQVTQIIAKRFEDKANPRVVVGVTPAVA